jgi:hypothetical protein
METMKGSSVILRRGAISGSARVSHAAVGVAPNAFGKCSQRDAANGDRDGRAPQFELKPKPAWSRRS